MTMIGMLSSMPQIPHSQPQNSSEMNTAAAFILAIGILTVGLAACEKKEGPAERAGKEIDKTLEKAGQQIEKAGDRIQDAAKDAKK